MASRKEQEFSIDNELGLHLRAAGKLAQLAGGFKCEVWLIKDGTEVNGKSIMGVLSLAAARGSKLTVRCTGDDADTAMEAIAKLIHAKFHEA